MAANYGQTLALQELKRRGIGIGDAALNIGSSIVAEPVAGLAGLLTAGVGGGHQRATNTVNNVRNALTYQPRTQEGQSSLQTVGQALQPIAEGFEYASSGMGDYVMDKTGSEALATAAYSVPTAAAELLTFKTASPLLRSGRNYELGNVPRGINNQTGAVNPKARAAKKELERRGVSDENLNPLEAQRLEERLSRVQNFEEGYRLPNLHNQVPKDYLPAQYGKETVTIYRGVPSSVKGATIREGDWVSLDKDYAKQHGTGETGKSKIISMEVPADSVGWAGTDMNEYFYVPRQANKVGESGVMASTPRAKAAGLNNISGKEYLVYQDHENFSKTMIQDAAKQELKRRGVDIESQGRELNVGSDTKLKFREMPDGSIMMKHFRTGEWSDVTNSPAGQNAIRKAKELEKYSGDEFAMEQAWTKKYQEMENARIAEREAAQESYKMQHTAPTLADNPSAVDLNDSFPDIYTGRAKQYYGTGASYDDKAIRVIQSMKGKPNKLVTIYRAVPDNVEDINPKDWVTTTKEYARDHIGDDKGWKILTKQVKASELASDGNSIHEFGYDPQIN